MYHNIVSTQRSNRFNVISINVSVYFWEKLIDIIKFIWKYKRPSVTKIIFKKEKKFGGPVQPNFNVYNTKLQYSSQ